METVSKFDGVSAIVLKKLVEMGYYKTKSDAIRAGILELGKEFEMLDPKELEAELVIRKVEKIDQEIGAGKRKTVSFDEVLKKAKINKRDL